MVSDKKSALTYAAAALFHEKGLGATSIADIAKRAGVPVGNVSYYFKTKEEIGLAAAIQRKEEFQGFTQAIDERFPNPLSRLREAAGFFAEAKADYISKGCPIAQMCQTGDVAKDPVAQAYAEIDKAYILWVASQFESLGHSKDAPRFAQHFLSRLLGAALVAKTTQNAELLEQEVDAVQEWLKGLEIRAAAA